MVLTFVLSNIVNAQTKKVSHENQQWIQYYNETKLNKTWTLLTDASFRWKEAFNENSQFLVRTGLGYSIAPNLRIGGGFTYVGFYSQDTLNKIEYRPHQDLVFKSTYNKIKISQRVRIEERFFNPLNNPNHSFNFRFRYSFNVSVPIAKLSKSNPDCIFLLNIGDEIFINTGKETPTQTFDQNRFIISPTFQLNKRLSISPTFNSQFASTTTARSYKQTNVFWLQVRHNLDLNKNNKTK
ncbi:DUF2490 domain-containing protein [Confluentibacter sediminis]|uniref:DUF2490 domain-containing protein n=1 Tax=Confluentibacter sediminis TaxID=2219045 RepID=UPI0013A70529|nr:DUF2490 domain-containing protein [Confluentibacter sediminis]